MMEPIVCAETSVINYQNTLRNISVEHRSHLHQNLLGGFGRGSYRSIKIGTVYEARWNSVGLRKVALSAITVHYIKYAPYQDLQPSFDYLLSGRCSTSQTIPLAALSRTAPACLLIAPHRPIAVTGNV
jgi:hypothetical protein